MSDKKILVQIPTELLQAIDAEAARSVRTRAAVMRSAMRVGLAAKGAETCQKCEEIRRVLATPQTVTAN